MATAQAAVVEQTGEARDAHKELGSMLGHITRKYGPLTAMKAAAVLLAAVVEGRLDGSQYLYYKDEQVVGCAIAHLGWALGYHAPYAEPVVPGWRQSYYRAQSPCLSPLEHWVRFSRPGRKPATMGELASLERWLDSYLKRAAKRVA